MSSDVWRQAEFEAELLHDATLSCRVIKVFVDDLPTTFTTITNAFAAQDVDTLAKAAHYLHGSAVQLQLPALAKHSQLLHQQALTNSLDDDQLQQLLDAAENARPLLFSYLEGNNSLEQSVPDQSHAPVDEY